MILSIKSLFLSSHTSTTSCKVLPLTLKLQSEDELQGPGSQDSQEKTTNLLLAPKVISSPTKTLKFTPASPSLEKAEPPETQKIQTPVEIAQEKTR